MQNDNSDLEESLRKKNPLSLSVDANTLRETDPPEAEKKSKAHPHPFRVPIRVKKPVVGITWYIVFATYAETVTFVSTHRSLKNAYAEPPEGWNDSKSLASISNQDYFIYIPKDRLKRSVCVAMGQEFNEHVTMIEISAGFQKKYQEELHASALAVSTPRRTPFLFREGSTPRIMSTPRNYGEDLGAFSPRFLLSPTTSFDFFPAGKIVVSFLRDKIVATLAENILLREGLEALKAIAVIDYDENPNYGHSVIFSDAKDSEIFLTCLQILSLQPIVVFEHEHCFNTKVHSLVGIPSHLGAYYRFYTQEELAVFFNKEPRHKDKVMIELSPGAAELYAGVNNYLGEQIHLGY